MKIVKTSYFKNPFLGLFMRTSDEVTLLPKHAPSKIAELARETLSTKVVELFVNQSALIGLMAVMNKNGCVLASQAEREEVHLLKKQGLNVHVLREAACPGNLILANDFAAALSPLLSRTEATKISECLGVEAVSLTIGSMKTIGALNVVSNKGVFAYNDITEVELKKLERIFHVSRGEAGTVNTGTPFNSIGVVANSHGALVGETTTGFEVQRIYQALSGD